MRRQLRKKVFRVAGNRCVYCKQHIPIEERTIDHIVPKALGGTSDLENLMPACRLCNVSKGDMPLREWCECQNLNYQAIKARISYILAHR